MTCAILSILLRTKQYFHYREWCILVKATSY